MLLPFCTKEWANYCDFHKIQNISVSFPLWPPSHCLSGLFAVFTQSKSCHISVPFSYGPDTKNPKCISFYSSVVTKATISKTYLFLFPCGTALLPRCHQKCRVLTRKCSRIVSFHQLAAFTTKPISNIVSCSKKFKHSLLLQEIQT